MFAARYDPTSLKRTYSESQSENNNELESDVEIKNNNQGKRTHLQNKDINVTHIKENENEKEKEVKCKNEIKNGSTTVDNDYKSDGENEKDESNNRSNEPQRLEDKKFLSIFKKLDKTRKINELRKKDESEVDNEDESELQNEQEHEIIESSDLAPIPQPELPKDKHFRITNNNSLNWISEPKYFQNYEKITFQDLFKKSNIDNSELLKNLKNNQFDKVFHVQNIVFNELYTKDKLMKFSNNSGDLLINSSTGSGKTLAYLVPIILGLSNRVIPKLACVILLPTKPLVLQVYKVLELLIKNLKINIMASNSNLSISKEISKFEIIKPDILVCTPGRLVDYLNYKDTISLKYLKYLVIDEVDKLLNQSFQNWINRINETIVKDQHIQIKTLHGINEIESFNHFSTQKLLFSATLNNDVNKLSMLNFYKPKLLIIDEFGGNNFYNLPEKLVEYETFVNKIDAFFKPLVLYKLIMKNSFNENVIIFVKSNENCLRLTKLLELLSNNDSNINFQYLNSTISTNNKKKILNKFVKKEINILLVTDLISRGLDLSNIETVINYDLPISTVDYIHRVGRTARAGKNGVALNLLVGNNDRKWFNKITKNIQRRNDIAKMEFATISDVEKRNYEDCLKILKQEVYESMK